MLSTICIQWSYLLFSSSFVQVLPLLLSHPIFCFTVSCFFCSYFSYSLCSHFSVLKFLPAVIFFKFCSPALKLEQDQHSQGEVRLKMYCFVPEHCGIKKELWRSSHLCQQGSSWIFRYLPIWLRKQHFNIYFLFLCQLDYSSCPQFLRSLSKERESYFPTLFLSPIFPLWS